MRVVASGATVNAAEVGDLGEAIKAVPACGGAVYIPAGTYEIDRTVEAVAGRAVLECKCADRAGEAQIGRRTDYQR